MAMDTFIVLGVNGKPLAIDRYHAIRQALFVLYQPLITPMPNPVALPAKLRHLRYLH